MWLVLLIVLRCVTGITAETDLAKAAAGILLTNFRDSFAPTLISQAARSIEAYRSQQDLVNMVISQLEGKIVVRFNVPSRRPLRRPWILHAFFIDSYEAFGQLYRDLEVDRYDYSGKYLIVYSSELDREVILHVFEDLLKLQIVNVVFAGLVEAEVELWTYVPFARESCLALNLIMLPGVDVIEDFFPDKTATFHGCTFKVGVFETKPYIILDYLPSQEPVLSGFEGDLLDALKAKLDFKTTLYFPPYGSQWGYALKRNSTGLMRMIQDEEVDFGIACLGISTARNDILKPGIVHYTTSLVIAVPPGRTYTSFEKLFRPFQLNVWIALVSLLAAGIITITVIELTNQKVRNFVYGRRIPNPYLNMIKILLGIGMQLIPNRNFARTLLILWVGHTLIMRTLYQGSLFKYLQLRLSLPPSRTLADVDATDAHYHVVDVGARYFEAFPHRVARLHLMPKIKDNIGARLNWMAEHPDSPDVMMGGKDHVAYHNRISRRTGGFVHIAQEFIATFTVAIYYPKKSMLTATFNRQIQWIQAAGLMNYWVSRYGDYDFFEKGRKVHDGPKPMSIVHVLGAFELYTGMIALSGIVFLAELLSIKIRVLWLAFRAFVR